MIELRRRIHLLHKHRAASIQLLVQRDGIPYRIQRTVCEDCARMLTEQPAQRATA